MTQLNAANPIANPGQFAAEADVRAMTDDPRAHAARAQIAALLRRYLEK